MVVVQDAAGFAATYPSVSSSVVAGVYTGQLSNSGESIRVNDVGGERILEFTYDDNAPWSPEADGGGASLELIDSHTSVDQLDNFFSWRASLEIGGTPGAALTPFLVGDVNQDGFIDFSDIPSFISVLQTGSFRDEADINGDGVVNFADISYFIDLLIAQ